MSTSVITTRTGLISDLGRTLPVVELQRHRIRVATRLSPCRDSVVCITATQSRPNNFPLRNALLRCQDRREIHARILAVEPLPLASGDAHSGRRPRHAKRCLPRRRLLHQRLAAFSFDEPQRIATKVIPLDDRSGKTKRRVTEERTEGSDQEKTAGTHRNAGRTNSAEC